MKYVLTECDSIQSVLNQAQEGDVLYLKNGIYKEKIEIKQNKISLVGEDPDKTIIVNHDFYHKIMPDFNECNTFRTYTCYVEGNDVTLSNLTIKNSATPSAKYGQAVALHVHGTHFICENVILQSAQDTLFTGPLPADLIQRHQGFLPKSFLKGNSSIQTYKNCQIYGDVDFIFGGATALFEDCKIISIARQKKNAEESSGFICAPSHDANTPFGYLFYHCDLIAEDDSVSYVYLARPWRDYGCAAFIECNLHSHIHPLGFNKWGNTHRDQTARFYEYSLNQDLTKREKWAHLLSKQEATQYVHTFMEFMKKN